jgi:hypothetical protein
VCEEKVREVKVREEKVSGNCIRFIAKKAPDTFLIRWSPGFSRPILDRHASG